MKTELLMHIESYHTNRLGYLRDKRRQIREGAYQEQSIEEFYKNKGRLEIINTLINIEQSILESEKANTEVSG